MKMRNNEDVRVRETKWGNEIKCSRERRNLPKNVASGNLAVRISECRRQGTFEDLRRGVFDRVH